VTVASRGLERPSGPPGRRTFKYVPGIRAVVTTPAGGGANAGDREREDREGSPGDADVEGADADAETDWDAEAYDGSHSFVYEYGEDVVERLDPGPGERVLDLGCGTAHLTERIEAAGAAAVGLDRSVEMLSAAREREPALALVRGDARGLPFDAAFDAAFSNAALHWIPEADQDAVLASVASALRPGGRFVAELGGRGNVASVVEAVRAECAARGYPEGGERGPGDGKPGGNASGGGDGNRSGNASGGGGGDGDGNRRGDGLAHPWYFPSVGEYATRLEAAGFEVEFARLFDRPTVLDGGADGLATWLETFGDDLLAPVPEGERGVVVEGVADRLRDELFRDGSWVADYRRLRVAASLPAE
jgi:SAM-dependent methyltransferase